jgi:hypothetical protein
MDAQELQRLKEALEMLRRGASADMKVFPITSYDTLKSHIDGLAERAVSPAESVQSIDTPEFRNLLQDHRAEPASFQKFTRLVAHIDAKIAQTHREEWMAMESAACNVEAHNADEWKARAEKAESRLAEIQRGVEGLTHYTMWDGNLCETQAGNHPERVYVNLEKVLALLQPRGQADTSNDGMVFKDCHFDSEPKPGVLFFKSGAYNPDSGETTVTVTLRADGSIRLVKTDATLNPDMSPFLQKLLNVLQKQPTKSDTSGLPG